MLPLSYPKYKVAAVQAAPVYSDLDKSIDKCVSFINEAASKGAKLIAFPEAWIPGYPIHIWLGSAIWQIKKGYVQKYYDNSLDFNGPEADRLRKAVRDANITAVIGVSERQGYSLYISQWILGPDGETIATRRKIRPTHFERATYGEGDGSDVAVYETPLGKLGALNCWEHVQPLTKYAMYSQGEQVHVCSWPGLSFYQPDFYQWSAEANSTLSRAYAIQGACFTVVSTAVVTQEQIDSLCDMPEQRALIEPGGGFSAIYAPSGQDLVTPLKSDEEGMLIAEIDLKHAALSKQAIDPMGHYSRPDIHRLLFNPNPLRRVEFFGESADSERTRIEPLEVVEQEEELPK